MKSVALYCARLVHQELIDITLASKVTPSNCTVIDTVTYKAAKALLESRMEVTEEILENYIDVQASSGLVFDPHYRKSFIALMGKINMVDLSDVPLAGTADMENQEAVEGIYSGKLIPAVLRNEMEENICDCIKQLVFANFNVVRKQVQDYVPKSLQNSLIYNVVDNLKYELVSSTNHSILK